jgi:hypothetical protein
MRIERHLMHYRIVTDAAPIPTFTVQVVATFENVAHFETAYEARQAVRRLAAAAARRD